MARGETTWGGAALGLGAAALLAACFVSADQKKLLTCDEAAERGFPCEPVAGAAGLGGSGASGVAGAPSMGGGGGGSGGAGGLGGGGASGAGGAGGLGCSAPTVDCGGACVDVTASDAANCGECGYACGAGSTCTAGVCSPVAVVSGVVAPYAFAFDAESVYFVVPVKDERVVPPAVPPAVQRVPRAGGAPTSVFGTIAPVRSRSLALANGTLYFGDLDNNGVIRKGATTGGDVDTHLANQPAVQHLVAADGRLWWSTFDGNSRLRRAPTTGTPAMAEELLPGPSFVQFGRVPTLAVEGTGAAATAFWVNAGGSVATDKGLWRKAGATAPTKVVPDGAMVTLALGESEVFVADATAGLGKVAASVTAPATLTSVVQAADIGGTPQGLAVAGGKLYWLSFHAGQLEVHRSGLDGTDARVLGRVAAKSAAYWAQPIGPAQLTVDGGFVYFSDPGTLTGNTSASNPGLEGVTGAADGAIYRLPP